MKFLWLSEAGDGMGLALRVAEEGNDVALFIKQDDDLKIGDGLVPKVTDWGHAIDPETVIVADCTGWGTVCDALRAGGYPVIGGSTVADRLEMDRKFGAEVMKAAGIQLPASSPFTDWEQGLAYVKKNADVRLVFKPEGDLSGNLPSYPSKGAEDLIEWMTRAQRKYFGTPTFTLQEFIEGVVISTEAYFDGSRFVAPFNHTLEVKALMNGNKGPSGGCTGNIVWACDDQISDAAMLPLEPWLREQHYVGPIDLNVVANEKGIWGLEFTPRFGYDASPTLLWTLLDQDLGQLLSDVANGQTDAMHLFEGYATGIKLSLPPWPWGEHDYHYGPEGVPLRGLSSGSSDQLYPYQLMRVDGEVVTAGCQGIVGIALGLDSEVKPAWRTAYKIADRIQMPDLQYRTDLANTFEAELEQLDEYTGAKA